MIKEVKSTASIKQQNVKSIKKVILEKGSVTKPEVAEKTGLSVVTCGTILNELTADELKTLGAYTQAKVTELKKGHDKYTK